MFFNPYTGNFIKIDFIDDNFHRVKSYRADFHSPQREKIIDSAQFCKTIFQLFILLNFKTVKIIFDFNTLNPSKMEKKDCPSRFHFLRRKA